MESEVASITAKEKLEEAKFFLGKLRGSAQLLPQDLPTQKESYYYLSAFLSATVSVIDYLLEDYNIKFALNIPLTEKWLQHAFEKEANRTNNQAALQFLQWWKKERETVMKSDPIGKLLNKRHINIHRVQTKPDLAKIKTGDGIVPSSGSLETKVFREAALGEIRKTLEQPRPKSEVRETTFDWFFSDYPDEPMITVCEKSLDRLENFVSKAEKRFP